MSTVLNCWLNTSETKSILWLKPKTDGLLKSNPFLNLSNSEETDILVSILRKAYKKGTSFEINIDMNDIRPTKSGSLAVKSTLDSILETMTKSTKAEQTPVDNAVIKRANSVLAELDKLPDAPIPTPAADSSTESEDIEVF